MLSAEATKDEIIQVFGPELEKQPYVLERIQSIIRTYSITPADLHNRWEALTFRINTEDFLPNEAHLNTLQNEIRAEIEAMERKRMNIGKGSAMDFLSTKTVVRVDKPTFTQDDISDIFSNKRKKVAVRGQAGNQPVLPSTPIAAKYEPVTFSPSSLSQKFHDRTQKLKSEEIFNEAVPYSIPLAGPVSNITVSLIAGQLTKGLRYMYEKDAERGDQLNNRLDQFEGIILDQLREEFQDKMSDKEQEIILEDPSCPQQEEFYTVGRIHSDSHEATKINEQSLTLEPSRDLGVGIRTKINLNDIIAAQKGFSLFPGQIVGLKAVNPSGQQLDAIEIIPPKPLPKASTESRIIVDYYKDTNDAVQARPINIVVSSGPYSLDDSLGFEPFEEFTDHILKEVPEVIVLIGPFIDTNHQMIQNGETEFGPSELFKKEITTRITKIQQKRAGVKIILIPSLRDLCLSWNTCPQPPLCSGLTAAEVKEQKRKLGLDHPDILLFPNPVQFRINEVVIAATSVDSLFHLTTEEISRPSKDNTSQDRIYRLFSHMLSQRTFYPIYPPKDFYMNISRQEYMDLKATPDILITPSCLRHCVKNVDGTLCINPGYLTKGNSAGTFVRLTIHPLDVDKMKDSDVGSLPHCVDGRCRVEIVRI